MASLSELLSVVVLDMKTMGDSKIIRLLSCCLSSRTQKSDNVKATEDSKTPKVSDSFSFQVENTFCRLPRHNKVDFSQITVKAVK